MTHPSEAANSSLSNSRFHTGANNSSDESYLGRRANRFQ